MNPTKAIKTFTEHHPFVGPAFWIASVQFLIAQLIVATAWPIPYSWRLNAISDLGNTACGTYADRYVCSPLHDIMNVSIILLGLTMIAGSVLIYRGFQKSPGTALGFILMALSGFGTVLLGLFPENTVSLLHFIGALFGLLVGPLGMIVLGVVLDIPPWLRWYTLLSGFVSLLALILLTSGHFLGLGFGGIERLVAHPQTLWLIVFGIYISSNHVREMRLSSHK